MQGPPPSVDPTEYCVDVRHYGCVVVIAATFDYSALSEQFPRPYQNGLPMGRGTICHMTDACSGYIPRARSPPCYPRGHSAVSCASSRHSAQSRMAAWRSRLVFGIDRFGQARFGDIQARCHREPLRSDLESRHEPYFVPTVCRQLAISSDGRHIRHDVERFSSIRDRRATGLVVDIHIEDVNRDNLGASRCEPAASGGARYTSPFRMPDVAC